MKFGRCARGPRSRSCVATTTRSPMDRRVGRFRPPPFRASFFADGADPVVLRRRRSTRPGRTLGGAHPPSPPPLVLPSPPSPSRSAGPTAAIQHERHKCFRRVNSGGECGAPQGEEGSEFTASGVPREAFQPEDLAFPQISAPRARRSPPVFTLRNHCPELPSDSVSVSVSTTSDTMNADSDRALDRRM